LSAAAAIERARAVGLRLVATDAGTLRLEADAEPPADVLADLRRHKAEVLALLRASDGSGATAAGAGRIGGIGSIGGPMTPMTPMPQATEALVPDRVSERVSARELAEAAEPDAGPGDAPEGDDAPPEPEALPYRLPAWGDPSDVPRPGDRCGCCGRHGSGGRWWTERTTPKGWRCCRCHPAVHLPAGAVIEVRT
jgi:hypothetical protein